MGWFLVCLHAAWFFLAIANMSPPAPALAQFLDNGGWSSATVFAGRPFHFTYELMFLKAIVLVDMPSMLAAIPIGLLLSPLEKAFHVGSYVASYVEAALLLLLASCQWLAIGSVLHSWLKSRHSGTWFLQRLDRYFVILIVFVFLFTVIAVPRINERSRRLGFRHGGISFH